MRVAAAGKDARCSVRGRMGPPDPFHEHLARERPFSVVVHVSYDGALVEASAHVHGFEMDELT